MRFLKILGYTVIVLAAVLAVGITFTIGWRPFIGPKARPLTDRKFDVTPIRLARGRYLAENVARRMTGRSTTRRSCLAWKAPASKCPLPACPVLCTRRI